MFPKKFVRHSLSKLYLALVHRVHSVHFVQSIQSISSIKSILSIPSILVAILCWWLVAFKNPVADEPHLVLVAQQPSLPLSEKRVLALSRSTLAAALQGDVALMGKLILDWNLDADLIELQSKGPVKRLDKETLIRSQVMTRLLTEASEEELSEWNETYRKKMVVDDIGYPINLETPLETFLPQTFMAADILLCFVDPTKIAALPSGFRTQTALYAPEKLASIPLNIDHYQSEKLYLASPDVALIAQNFSHPSTIEAMKHQGITIYTTTDIYEIEDIKRTVGHIGHLTNTPLKGELLTIFIEAALNAIDNRRSLDMPDPAAERILVVNYHSQFSLPGKKTLTATLLERIGLQQQMNFSQGLDLGSPWSVPLYEEQIYAFAPATLLIIGSATEDSHRYFSTLPALRNIQKIHVLDQQMQHTVSHQIVLAYYDLNNALVKLDE